MTPAVTATTLVIAAADSVVVAVVEVVIPEVTCVPTDLAAMTAAWRNTASFLLMEGKNEQWKTTCVSEMTAEQTNGFQVASSNERDLHWLRWHPTTSPYQITR